MPNVPSVVERLAVCSWSLQPESADDLFTKLAATGLARTQIALDPIRENAEDRWSDFRQRAEARGVTCVSGMFVTAGEDYSTLESIRRTGGVVPDETWEENWRNIQANAELAAALELRPELEILVNDHTTGGQPTPHFDDQGCPPGTNAEGRGDYYDLPSAPIHASASRSTQSCSTPSRGQPRSITSTASPISAA